MEQLDKDFAAYARDRANKLAPGLDWSRPNRKNNRRRSDASDSASAPDNQISTNLVRVVPEESAATWASNHPTNFWVMTDKAAELIGNKDWAAAKTVLEKLVDLYPDSTGPDGALRMLAAAYRELDQTNAEHQILVKLAEKDDAAPDAYLRLMQLDSAAANWNAVVLNANRYLAVDPLVAPPYRYLSSAAEKSGQPQSAIAAWRALIELDPPDPAEAHYQLARLLHQSGDSGARRQVLLALEDAPRYPAALRLLLDINAESPPGAGGSPAAKP
jgi:tetratricopeptide (TPR) repeat protein